MLAKTASVALVGTEARLVDIEIHKGGGLPAFPIVGMPHRSVKEAEQRVKSALHNSQEKWPSVRVTANLAPGTLRKEGTHFDLALALGVMGADQRLPAERLQGWVVLGELGLDGSVRSVRGCLSAALACRAGGMRGIVCPLGNAAEAALVADIEIVPVRTLGEAGDFFRHGTVPHPVPPPLPATGPPLEDISEVRGHDSAKTALEIAAAGGHNLMLCGPPGSGKTMLARRLPGIMPAMSLEESLEVTRVHSVAGLLSERASLVQERPFRVPHHHTSLAGLIGGGPGLARPGEISLAHHGVLFLDELSLYPRSIVDSLRAPLEDGVVFIARSGGSIKYPCRFSLVAATNPCPCGFRGDSVRTCRCSDMQLAAHSARLSGPLLDRIDLQVMMPRVDKTQLLGAPEGDTSEVVRARVERVRAVQAERYGSTLTTNASAARAELSAHLGLTADASRSVGRAIDLLALSGRGLDRVLRVARTIADLDDSQRIDDGHIGRALSMRAFLDDKGAAA